MLALVSWQPCCTTNSLKTDSKVLSDNGKRNNGNLWWMAWNWFPCSSDWLAIVLIRFVTELFKSLIKLSHTNPLIQDTDSHISSNIQLVHTRYTHIHAHIKMPNLQASHYIFYYILNACFCCWHIIFISVL